MFGVFAMTFCIAQLSDLHLSTHQDDPSHQTFMACLEFAISHRPDLLLLTGDLVNDGRKAGYDWLFKTLHATHLPFVCLAGNHDVTKVVNPHLPYTERQFVAIARDTRLPTYQMHTLNNHWQLICLSSAVAGADHGYLDEHVLDWLDNTLAIRSTPTLIALHHHPILVGSAWIDALALQNREALWAVLGRHPHIRAVLCGHVHQAHDLVQPNTDIRVLTCPATSRQFLPRHDDFALDNAPAGIRLITLDDHGKKIDSTIHRLAIPSK